MEETMANVDWRFKGAQYANCNCAWGCPCQFNALPTYGDCRTVVGISIDEGHFGEVRLDGLACVGFLAWPGAIHEGNGTQLYVIDERADADQRHGLLEIPSWRSTWPRATPASRSRGWSTPSAGRSSAPSRASPTGRE
jgi:hypothetical protein